MKYLKFFLLLLLIHVSVNAFSQSRKCDSISRCFAKQPVDIRVESLLSISDSLFCYDILLSECLTNKALKLATQLSISELVTKTNLLKGKIALSYGRYAEACAIFDSTKVVFRQTENLTGQNDINNYLGQVYFHLSEYHKSLSYHKLALDYFQNINDSVKIIYTKNQIANTLIELGQLDSAVEYNSESIEYYYRHKSKKDEANSLMTQGNIHFYYENYAITINNFLRASMHFNELNNKLGAFEATIKIGQVYMKTERFDNAFNYFVRSLELGEKLRYGLGVAIAKSNLANVYFIEKKIDLAFKSKKAAIQTFDSTNSCVCYIKALNELGQMHSKMGHFEKAKDALKRSLNKAITISHLKWQLTNYKALADVCNLAGLHDEAYENLTLFVKLDKQLFNLETSSKISALELRHDIVQKKKEEQISLMRQKERVSESDMKYMVKINSLIITILFLAIILIFLLFSNSKKKKRIHKKNKEVDGKNAQLKTEMTERSKVEHLLIAKEAFLSSLINSIPNQIFYKDKTSIYTGCNPAFNQFYGFTSRQVIGKNDHLLFDTKIADAQLVSDTTVLQTQKSLLNKSWQISCDGNRVLIETLKTPFFNAEGEILGIVGISRDITEHFENERALKNAKAKAEQADKLKSAFLANMSHEIRTPMNSIVGFSNLLNFPGVTDVKRQKYTKLIDKNARHLLSLVEDIVDIAKIESGQMELSITKVPLSQVIKQIHRYAIEKRNLVAKNNIDLRCASATEENSVFVLTDLTRLQQVLKNLILNAIKYTNSGYVVFGYNLKNTANKGGNLSNSSENSSFIEFYVKDTGIGIADDMQGLIFDNFGKVTYSDWQNIGGTGLGLAISKRLVHLLGGEIYVESKLSHGSTFYFTIPYTNTNSELASKREGSSPTVE